MIFLEMQQGTPQWLQARAKRITASCFSDAVSRVGGLDERQSKYVSLVRGGMAIPEAVKEAGYKAAPSADTVRRALLGEDTSEHSDTAKRYAADLAIERISGEPHGEPPKAWVLERGHEMETRARMLYEARTGAFITESGICISDDGVFAYSSDGLVNEDGLIEIKAPIDSIKIMEMWRTGDTKEYDHQMQGGLWLTARKWVDFIMFVPDLAAAGKDLFVKRIYRDDTFIDKMVEQLVEFDRLVESYTIILRAGTMPVTTIEEYSMSEVAIEQSQQARVAAETKRQLEEQQAAIAAQNKLNDQAAADMTERNRLAAIATNQQCTAEQTAANIAADGRAAALLEQGSLTDLATDLVAAGLFADVVPDDSSHTPPTLRLGQIGERLGFTVTADFMLSLGFAPAATDKAAKLYHEADFQRICAAMQRHIEAARIKYTAKQPTAEAVSA